MKNTGALSGLIFVVIVGIGAAFIYAVYSNTAYSGSLSIAVGVLVAAIVASSSI